METDPAKPFLVEEMNDQQFLNHLAGRQLAVTTLNMATEDYAAKHLLLDQAVQQEKTCSESQFPVQCPASLSISCWQFPSHNLLPHATSN